MPAARNTTGYTKKRLAEMLAEAEAAFAAGREPALTEKEKETLAKMTKTLTREVRRRGS